MAPQVMLERHHSSDMVRAYVRKTKRGAWDDRQMVAAMNAIRSRKMGYMKASKVYGIPRSTLRRIIKRLEADGEVNIRLPLGTNAAVFTSEEEKYLVAHLSSMANRLFNVTIQVQRKVAYQLAEKNCKSHKWKDNVAGREWLREFVRRHKMDSRGIGRPVTKPKVACFNKEAVMKFYDVLGELYLKYHFTPDRIYNCDETSISCDTKYQGDPTVFNENNKVPARAAVSGHTITVEVCMSATGLFMPLLFVFPRKTLEPQFTNNLILPCYTQCNETGWMQSEIFAWWLNHFIKFSRATKENPVLLLCDGDASHTTSLEILELAESNGVIMLCLPEFCTHKVGPLEVEFFGTLSKHYGTAVKEWSAAHPTQLVGICEIPMLFEQAFIQSATLATAVVAFRKTGLWPFKPNIFSDQDFTGAGTSILARQMAGTVQRPNSNVITTQPSVSPSSNAKAVVATGTCWKPTNNCAMNQPAANLQGNVKAVVSGASWKPINNCATIQPTSNPSNNVKAAIVSGTPWKPTNNCVVNEMRIAASSNCGGGVLGGPQNQQQNHPQSHSQHQPPRKRIYQEPAPQVASQNYQSNNFHEPSIPGPSWKPPSNAVNEMRLSASSAYVEAVLGGTQNHPPRNMEQSEGPGSSCDPSMYNIIPHMFL